MTEGQRTPQSTQRQGTLADAATGWVPDRGDLAYDTTRKCVGVVVALPVDTDTTVFHMRPEGGGDGWTAPLGRLRQHPDVRELYRAAYVLLDLKGRPTPEATQFGANEYMRELARHTKRLAAVYREEHGDGEARP